MNNDIAIKVSGVSKTFRIPHEKVSSVRGAVVNAFKKSSFEEFKALDDISFEVKKGEFFGIIGRNGSGKSTLLKILAGIYQADKGSVKIDGRISPFLELGIGFNPELSGRDNVYLNATVLGLTKKEIDKKFDDIVKFSELERFIDQKLKNYSSGMQVRLAFSVSIHANREILLMDEVLAVGDSNFQSKCLEEFSKYREMGRTVIIVTHDIGVVQRYCDRAMLVRNGKIVKIGNSDDVGNEYIHQNILDEEMRIKKNESNILTDDKCVNKRIAEISKVLFLDKDGVEKNVFEIGDDILVRIYFKQNIQNKKLNFGAAIFNQDNKYIFGINTFIDNINTDKYLKQGFFDINYTNVNLGVDSYFLKIGIWGSDATRIIDFLDRSNLFKIYSSSKNEGMVHLNYHWEL
jgi:ABC-type polysaccharide/polyol phosphate transport system ATPase subunit